MRVDPADDDAVAVLAELIRAQRRALVAVGRREGLAPEDAVECAQDAFCTFLQILLRGDAPAERAGWPAYVAAIARNAARNRRRRHDRARPHESVADVADVAGDDASAEALVAAAEDHVRLRACVAQLCETQRSVVTLRLLEERDGEDVASVLGIRRGTVDVLLHRAKASLRACMEDESPAGR